MTNKSPISSRFHKFGCLFDRAVFFPDANELWVGISTFEDYEQECFQVIFAHLIMAAHEDEKLVKVDFSEHGKYFHNNDPWAIKYKDLWVEFYWTLNWIKKEMPDGELKDINIKMLTHLEKNMFRIKKNRERENT